MGRLTVADAKRMCTKAELGVVMGSRPDAIEQLSADQLKKNVASARRLRDKWRDLSTEQRRETQQAQNSRVTDKNARSGEKAALFGHVLKRYEDQLKQAETVGAGGGKTLAKPAKKKVRAAGHRIKRAVVRDELKDVRSELNAASKAKVKKKAAKKKAAAPATAAPKKKAAKKKVAAKKVAKKKVAKKAAKKKPAFGVGSLGLVTAEPARQLSAETAAKKNRLKASGKTSRVQAHVQARGGRKQAKRDSR